MQMTDGAMQSFALTLDKFIEHAAKWHHGTDVVTAVSGRSVARTSYAELNRRARQVTLVLRGLGVRPGERIGTLAWNTHAHLEAWYGIVGMGAICHTLNPRLVHEQLATMVMQSGARVLIVSADLLPLARRIAAATHAVGHLLVMDGAVDSPPAAGGVTESLLEDLLGKATGVVTWGEFDENAPCGLCYTSGTTGTPKGVTYTHRASFLHTLRVLQADNMALTARDSGMRSSDVGAVAPPIFAWHQRAELRGTRFGDPPATRTIDDWGPLLVPPGHYWMMGDNRHDSYDSRYYGFVPRANVRGRPLFVYWSYDNEACDFPIHCFWRGRWSRLGHVFK